MVWCLLADMARPPCIMVSFKTTKVSYGVQQQVLRDPLMLCFHGRDYRTALEKSELTVWGCGGAMALW